MSVGGKNVGAALDRIDGPRKVRGEAQYAADFQLPRLVHGVIVFSTIAAGTCTIDAGRRARQVRRPARHDARERTEAPRSDRSSPRPRASCHCCNRVRSATTASRSRSSLPIRLSTRAPRR